MVGMVRMRNTGLRGIDDDDCMRSGAAWRVHVTVYMRSVAAWRVHVAVYMRSGAAWRVSVCIYRPRGAQPSCVYDARRKNGLRGRRIPTISQIRSLRETRLQNNSTTN